MDALMLKRRLIPKLLFKKSSKQSHLGSVLVTTLQFGKAIEVGDPVSQAKIYEAQVADELILLDLDATPEGRPTDTQIVEKLAEEIFMPFTVGGGVRNVEDFRRLLNSGADKVSVNSAAVKSPELISEAAARFGKQCVVLSIDYRIDSEGVPRVWTSGGKIQTSLKVLDWAIQGAKLGAGEILLSSIQRDGSRQGLDLKTLSQITQAVSIPVIASGGCGKTEHFIEGFQAGAHAVSAGTYFSFKDENPMQTRSQIKNAGIPIRIHI
jgi:cyclase